MLIELHKVVRVEFNEIEYRIIYEAFEAFPRTGYISSEESDQKTRLHHQHNYDVKFREDYDNLKEDFLKYKAFSESNRFNPVDWDKRANHHGDVGRELNGQEVQLFARDVEILVDILEHFDKHHPYKKRPKGLIDGVGQIYKEDIDKLIKDMKDVRTAMRSYRVKEVDYVP